MNPFQPIYAAGFAQKNDIRQRPDFEADGDDECEDNDEELDYEEKKLNSLLKKSSNFSMNAISAIAYKYRLGQRPSSNPKSNPPKFRSHSVLNEPYNYPTKKSNLTKSTFNNNNNSSRHQTNEQELPHNNKMPTSKGLEINRKKSKSVTFMDSIGGLCSSRSQQNSTSDHMSSRNYYNHQKRPLMPPRSKSTTPFSSSHNQCNYVSPFAESDDFVSADVDDPCVFNADNKFRNCLIEPISKEASPHFLNLKKPNVGITAQTRRRRPHTLDLIRSSRMPLEHNVNLSNLRHQFQNNHKGTFFSVRVENNQIE